jgi:hypothetical protein
MLKNTWRPFLLPVIIGTALSEVVNYALAPDNYFKSPPKVIFSFIIGAAIGWMYEVIKQQSELLFESFSQLDNLSKSLEYQQEALTMLLKCRRHGEALTALLSDSIGEKYRYIAFVNETTYLSYLVKAIKHSNRYEGVQRKPVSWFKDAQGFRKNYLNTLRDQQMRLKIRIFVIDDEDLAQMKHDLSDSDLMDYYWSNTGIDVKTFWISSSSFKRNFPEHKLVEDFALYDGQLLIKYDEDRQTVIFDVLENLSEEAHIFKRLQQQTELNISGPFTEVKPLSKR